MKTINFFVLVCLSLHFLSASGSDLCKTGECTIKNSFSLGTLRIGNSSHSNNRPQFSSSFSSELFPFQARETTIQKNSFFASNPEKTMAEKIRTRTWISGSLFAASHATGYLLAASDKPHSTILLATHKITSASNLVMLDVTLFKKNKVTRLTTGEKIAAIIMNAAFVATIGTGGRLSMKKPAPSSIQNIHQFAPYVTTISAGALLYLLNKNQ